MAAILEGRTPGQFILTEANGRGSRKKVTVTVAALTTLIPGTVLSKLADTLKYVPYDNDGSSGSDAAAAILYAELANATDAPADFTGVIVDWSAEVVKAQLVWATGLEASDKSAGLADLEARGVKALD